MGNPFEMKSGAELCDSSKVRTVNQIPSGADWSPCFLKSHEKRLFSLDDL